RRWHGLTGCAAGRQRPPSPVLHTVLQQRALQETRRGTAARHVAGLPRAAAPLTVSPPPRLLAVSMERLGPWPAMAIAQHPPSHFPPRPGAAQRLARLLVGSLPPKPHGPHGGPQGGNPSRWAPGPPPRPPHPPGFLGRPGP